MNPITLYTLHPRWSVVLAAVMFVAATLQASAQDLTVTKLTWNSLGLRSVMNNASQQNASPFRFPVGVRVTNNTANTATDLQVRFYWDNTPTTIYHNLFGVDRFSNVTLAPGESKEFYFYVELTRINAARGTSRQYYIEATATGFTSAATPRPRDLFIQSLIDQNRNSATSFTGPSTVLVGREYLWSAGFDTKNFSVIQGHISWSNPVIQIQSVRTEAGTDIFNRFWLDTCSWDEVNRTCTTTAEKAGGAITTTARALVAGPGSTTANTLIYDISGNSWHFNTNWQNFTIDVNAVEASIGGNIFADRNINAQWDQPLVNPEPALNNVLVSLYSGTGPGRTLLTTTTTTAFGVYFFEGLPAGTYEVEVDESTVPVSHVLTTGSNPQVITIANVDDTNNFVDFGYVDPVLYVSMEEMSASTAGPGSPAILAWTTGEEIDNAGFHIWRAEWNPTERLWLPFNRITSTLLPSEAGFTGGASYTFSDPVMIQEGETRRVYYIEDIDFAGVSTFHGPIILDIVSDIRSGVDEWMSY